MIFTKEDFEMLNKVWAYLNGKKLLIGAILTVLSMVAEQLAVLLPVLLPPATALRYVGAATAVVGILHKIYKFVYKEDHAV